MSTSKCDECSFLSLIQNRDYLIVWISQTRWILSVCVKYFGVLNPANESDSNMMNVLLSFVLTMTNCNQWKILRDSKMKPGLVAITDSFIKDLVVHGLYPALKQLLLKGLALHIPVLTPLSLTGIFSLAVRPLLLCNFSPECISLFVVHILSVPGFVLHINSLASEAYDVIVREKLCSRVVTYLYKSLPNQSIVDCGLEGSYALCLIANLIQLSLLEVEVLVDHCEEFCVDLLDRRNPISRVGIQFWAGFPNHSITIFRLLHLMWQVNCVFCGMAEWCVFYLPISISKKVWANPSKQTQQSHQLPSPSVLRSRLGSNLPSTQLARGNLWKVF